MTWFYSYLPWGSLSLSIWIIMLINSFNAIFNANYSMLQWIRLLFYAYYAFNPKPIIYDSGKDI